MSNNNIGLLLQKARKRSGIPIRTLANKMGVSPTTIANMGKGKTMLDRVADALGLTLKFEQNG